MAVVIPAPAFPSRAEDAERVFTALVKCEEIFHRRPGGGHWEDDVFTAMRAIWDHNRFLHAIEHLRNEGRATARIPDDCDEELNFLPVTV